MALSCAGAAPAWAETGKEAAGIISDELAYQRYLDGDSHAADLLVEKYGDALTLYIFGYLNDPHEAEDLRCTRSCTR